jgi:hypothetical protein
MSPLVTCLLGWGLGAAVWQAERPAWAALGSPPTGATGIVGITFPEDSAYAPPTVYVTDGSGALWFYHAQGIDSPKWVASTGGCTPCGGWLHQTCPAKEYPFLPKDPGRVVDCSDHLPDLPDHDPEDLLTRYILLDDGTVWRWSRPAEIVGVRQIYPACGLVLGIIGGGGLALLILRGGLSRKRDEEEQT